MISPVLAEYGQRENTRREHAALIRQHYQYREFAWQVLERLEVDTVVNREARTDSFCQVYIT
ncbi:DUF4158 domain-containing protein, partial [Escherichia coli]